MRLDFPPYAPDMPALAGVLSVADNVLPGPAGYRPLPGFVALPGSALPGYPLGGGSFLDADRQTTTFAGTATDLYRYTASAWVSVGSGFNASDSNPWSFQKFGQWVVASNGADAPQYYDLASSSAFEPLPGAGGTNPPLMKILAIVGDFLVGGVIDGNAAKIQWSGINNVTEWRPTVGQSDFNIFPDGGEVTAIAGGESGLVFQSECIRRMSYIGGDVIFDLSSVISPNIGCVHPRAFVQVGRLSFFLSPRGFMVCDGSTVTPIGDEAVDRTFLALMNRDFMGRMSCVADPVRKVVYWSVPAAEPSMGFAYSWALQRWSRFVLPCRLMAAGLSRDIALDEDFGTPDTLWDTGLSFDDPSYMGGAPSFYLYDAGNNIGALTGSPAAASLATPLMEPAPGACLRVQRVRPMTDAVAGMTLTLDARARLGDAAAASSVSALTAEGDMPILKRGRYMSARLDYAAGTAWTFASGLDVTGRTEAGLR